MIILFHLPATPHPRYGDEDFDDYELISTVYDDVYDAVGDDFTEDEVVEAIRECNYDTKKSVSYLLYGTYPDSQPSSRKTSNKSTSNTKPNQSTPIKQTAATTSKPANKKVTASKPSTTAKIGSQGKATEGKTETPLLSNKGAPSALALDLCTPPIVVAPPQLKNSAASSSSDIVAFSFSEPSPDDVVKEKQKMGFSKKPDKPRKDEPHLAATAHADAEHDDHPSAPQKGTSIKYKQNVKSKAVTADMKNMSISNANASTSAMTTTTNTAPSSMQPSSSTVKMHNAARRKSLEQKIKAFVDDANNKDHLNMVVIGHVDAGKSTTMGHLLYKLGYEKEAQQKGKSSFHFAWVLDEHETERSRGVTINVGIRAFDTEHHKITLLDAPGHRADVAVLMLDASLGSFENGFMGDGQTKEHTMLARSLGVTQLIVAINKLDMVHWDNARYESIVTTMTPFLKQAGFNLANVAFVPCSGLSGENLVKAVEPKLTSWYSGPSLIERIDKPFRMTINCGSGSSDSLKVGSDVYKPGQGAPAGIIVAGKIETGFVAVHDKVALSPNNHVCTVKTLYKNHEWGTAGDNVELGLSGVELNEVSAGPSDPSLKVPVVSKLRGQIVVFAGLRVPITPGTPIEFHTQSTEVAGKIMTLVALVDKATGEQLKAKPRFLTEGQAAVVDVVLASPVCVERYKDTRSLARFMLRDHGKTIAAGVVMELM